MVLGRLRIRFDSWGHSDEPAKTALIDSLEKRWGNSYQDVFISATILNPFIKTAPFNKKLTNSFSIMAIHGLFSRLYRKLFQSHPPSTLLQEIRNYLENKGEFNPLPSYLESLCFEAEQQVSLLLNYE
jgi:hypothetical protein